VIALVGTIACSTTPTKAYEAITGQWVAEFTDEPGVVYFSIQRRRNGWGNMNSSFEIQASSLQGLSATQAGNASGANVRFQLTRDAGSFECEGWFKGGKGSGHFTFVGNAGYASEMERLGYGQLTEDEVFTMAVFDVSRAFIQEIKGLGYDRVSKDQLVAMRIHGVTPEFIQNMQSRGMKDLTIDKLVNLRVHGIN
jgi:hypothetical protein